MKKKSLWITISIIMVLGLLIGVFGCKQAAPATTAPTQAPTASPAPSPSPSPSPAPSPTATAKPTATPSPTAPTPAQTKTWNLKMQYLWTPDATFPKTAIPAMVDRIQKGTNGRVKIELFPGGTLVPTNEAANALGNGTIHLLDHAAFYELGRMGGVANFAHWVPFSTKTPEEWYWFHTRFGQTERMREAFAKLNIYYIGANCQTGYGQILSKKPIKSLADVQGLKIRAGGGIAKLWEALGAKTSLVSWGEAYTSITTGILDAITIGAEASMVDTKIHEVAKYYVLPYPTPTSGTELDINMDIWKELPDDIKQVFYTAQTASYFDYYQSQAYTNFGAHKIMLDAGVQFVTLPAADIAKMTEVARSQWDSFATDDLSKKSLASLRDLIKYLGY